MNLVPKFLFCSTVVVEEELQEQSNKETQQVDNTDMDQAPFAGLAVNAARKEEISSKELERQLGCHRKSLSILVHEGEDL